MTEKEKIRKLDDLILVMEVNQEKARVMASNIDQNFFEENRDQIKLYLFDHYSVEFDILFDYIIQNFALLQQGRELLGSK